MPPKEFALLQLLLKRNGTIVSHRDIEQYIWPRQKVSYASLARCVHGLRRILGGDRQSFIETVPKRGYRLAVVPRLCAADSASAQNERTAEVAPLARAHFLQGLHEANRAAADSYVRAIKLFEEALIVDSGYAMASVAIANCRAYQMMRGYVNPQKGREQGLVACRRALAIDKNLASAHATLAWLNGTLPRTIPASLVRLERALERDPEYARGFSYMAWLLRALGRLEDAVAASRNAVRLDPHSILNRHALAWTLFCAGDVSEALEIERNVCHDMPWEDLGHSYTALFSVHLGMADVAIDAARQGCIVSGSSSAISTILAYVLARVGDKKEARSICERLRAESSPNALKPHLAASYATLGEKSLALELLRESRDEGCPWFPGARYDPRFGDLGSDSRFLDLFYRSVAATR